LRRGLSERLLCRDCEQRLKVFEDYFYEIWYASPRLPVAVQPKWITLSDLDYERFKLFHLSLLWRASAACRAEFNSADLGPHEDKIRRMLLDRVPGRFDEYSLTGAILVLPDSRAVCHDLIAAPFGSRIDGHRCYRAIYAGCVWTILTSRHGAVTSDPLALREDRGLFLPVQPLDEFDPFTRFAAERRRFPVRAKDMPGGFS